MTSRTSHLLWDSRQPLASEDLMDAEPQLARAWAVVLGEPQHHEPVRLRFPGSCQVTATSPKWGWLSMGPYSSRVCILFLLCVL